MRLLLAVSAFASGVVFTGAAAPAAEELAYVPSSTRRVCQLTGDFDRAARVATLSQTGKRFGVLGTDLGSSFEHQGKLFFLFGDTWGRPGSRDVLAWTESTDPSKIVLHCYEAADRRWLPLTVPGIKQGAFEIPSGGISIAGAIFVVCTTDHTEKKVMGRSVLAVSRDHGRTFRMLYELSSTKFINVAFWSTDDWLYIYGSGNYRKSNVCLARVKPVHLNDNSKLEYFIGVGTQGHPRWSPRQADAIALFQQPQIGEFSVSYLKPVKRYVMLYNASEPRGITMRSAEMPWGRWSAGSVIFDPGRDNGYGHFMHVKSKADGLSDPHRAAEFGGEYGPYIISRYTGETGGHTRIYYTMSTWNPYQVMVMQSDFTLRNGP